jgi:hypothetical protein
LFTATKPRQQTPGEKKLSQPTAALLQQPGCQLILAIIYIVNQYQSQQDSNMPSARKT